MNENEIREQEINMRDRIELEELNSDSSNCINKLCEILNFLLIRN